MSCLADAGSFCKHPSPYRRLETQIHDFKISPDFTMTSRAAFVALAALPFFASARPFFSQEEAGLKFKVRAPVTYSVVAVDGGSSTQPAAPTETITTPVTQTLVSTTISTMVVTQNQIPSTIYSTIVVTYTSVEPTTIFDTVSVPPVTQTLTPSEPPSTPVITSSDPPAIEQPAPTITVQAPASTITVDSAPLTYSQPAQTVTIMDAPSSSPYDDGMWHTTYYQYNTPPPSSASAVVTTASTWTWPFSVNMTSPTLR